MPLLCTSWCGYDEGVSIHSSLVALVIDVTKCIVYTQRLNQLIQLRNIENQCSCMTHISIIRVSLIYSFKTIKIKVIM